MQESYYWQIISLTAIADSGIWCSISSIGLWHSHGKTWLNWPINDNLQTSHIPASSALGVHHVVSELQIWLYYPIMEFLFTLHPHMIDCLTPECKSAHLCYLHSSVLFCCRKLFKMNETKLSSLRPRNRKWSSLPYLQGPTLTRQLFLYYYKGCLC